MGKDFGGRITVRLSTGQALSLRGTMNMNPSRQSNEAITNQDGSVDRVGTPQPARAEFTFADNKGIDLEALMKSDRFNITFDEEFGKRTHYFTDVFVVGDPQVNRMNGEVSGISIASENYSVTNN